jgi:hypothetical protein
MPKEGKRMPPLAIIAALVVGSIVTVNIAIGFWAFVLTPRQLRREQQEREAREQARERARREVPGHVPARMGEQKSPMSDRFAGLTVVLTDNLFEDDTQQIIDAIKMIKGVQGVTPLVSDSELYIAEQRARVRMQNHIIRALRDM